MEDKTLPLTQDAYYTLDHDLMDAFQEFQAQALELGIIVINEEGEPVYINHNAAALFGLETPQVLARNFLSVLGKGSALFRVLKRGKALTEPLFVQRDGKRVPIQVNAYPLAGPDGRKGACAYFYPRSVEDGHDLSSVDNVAMILAHELKNPLTLLRGCVQILQKRPERVDKFLKIILQETDRMDSLIHGILLLSNPFALEKEEVDLHEILQEIFLLYEPKLRESQITLQKRLLASRHHIFADGPRMKQVCMNLITNALEAMEGPGMLCVETRDHEDGQLIEMCITDTGPGIKEEELEAIFLPFYSRRKDKEGSGIGLTIAKRIVTEHCGYLEVDSSYGEGTTFFIGLPVNG